MSDKKIMRKILNESVDIFSASSKSWIKGAMAHDSSGNADFYNSADACSFCMLGVIRKVSDKKNFDHDILVDEIMGKESGDCSYRLTVLNDRRTTTRMQVVNFLQLSALAL